MQEESGKHLYGVMARTEEAALESQRQGGTFYPVSYKELSALVSDAPCVDYRGLGKDLLFRRLRFAPAFRRRPPESPPQLVPQS